MNLVQFSGTRGERRLGIVEGTKLRVLAQWSTTYELARAAIARQTTIAALAHSGATRGEADFPSLLAEGSVLPPFDHPDPAHCFVTGTGLTHLGSAKARDAMHTPAANAAESLTDSMRLFRLGLEGGRPDDGGPPVQPEWFYKGDGSFIVPPGHPLERPAFADDAGEEPELTGLYVIGDDGTPFRVGFALGNEFSDHVMERKNYLYLAHSKLRQCSIGPEVFVGELPPAIEGRVRILRHGAEHWSAPFLSGEEHMSYRISGLEHHHFKYRQFRRPGDVHVHFFGTSTLSHTAGVTVEEGDCFEISAAPFTQALSNPVHFSTFVPGPVRSL